MKTFLKTQFLLSVLIGAFGLISASRVTAQTFTTLHHFTFEGTTDGIAPEAGLILSGDTLYGTATGGGSFNFGTVFAVKTNGTAFTVVRNFSGDFNGYAPYGGLVQLGNTFYGTLKNGGNNNAGTVFAMNIDGTGFNPFYHFTGNADGGGPRASLLLSAGALYGTCNGGNSSLGTVFVLNSGFAMLHRFSIPLNNTNSDGANPASAPLIISGNTLYGTARDGGTQGRGTVFAVNTDGTGFTTLHSFTSVPGTFTNSDGANPERGLVLSGGTLYGTAVNGGPSQSGTIFALKTDGTGFTVLHSFAVASAARDPNVDGANPICDLILSGNTLYGTTSRGGSLGVGTVFQMNTDGSGFKVLHHFTDSDGANSHAGLLLAGNTLYGTTSGGGTWGRGTVFSLTLPPPQITLTRSQQNVVLTWPTNPTGFTLQSTTNLISPATWSTVSPAPTVVNGQNSVTTAISGARKFYRLSQ